jgi:hypothetical protein
LPSGTRWQHPFNWTTKSVAKAMAEAIPAVA